MYYMSCSDQNKTFSVSQSISLYHDCYVNKYSERLIDHVTLFHFFSDCLYRSSGVKRMIRVPAASANLADIPSDEFSWVKLTQMAILGHPYPMYIAVTFFHFFLVVYTDTLSALIGLFD